MQSLLIAGNVCTSRLSLGLRLAQIGCRLVTWKCLLGGHGNKCCHKGIIYTRSYHLTLVVTDVSVHDCDPTIVVSDSC